jgi:nucleoid-associated protein YgaU
MSSTVATRTTRFAPPAAPTRKPVPRRRVLGNGASAVGRVDRPVLRIVASRPSPSVEPVETPDIASVELVETTPRQIDLVDFFTPEYDGDDISLEVVRPRPSSVRLTRRGRLVVFGAGLAAVLGLGLFGAGHALAGDHPEHTKVVTVQPGQTLWDIASRASAQTGGDTRSMISHLESINHLDSTSLQVGQHLRVPR